MTTEPATDYVIEELRADGNGQAPRVRALIAKIDEQAAALKAMHDNANKATVALHSERERADAAETERDLLRERNGDLHASLDAGNLDEGDARTWAKRGINAYRKARAVFGGGPDTTAVALASLFVDDEEQDEPDEPPTCGICEGSISGDKCNGCGAIQSLLIQKHKTPPARRCRLTIHSTPSPFPCCDPEAARD